jgi:CheY-like chemotaxis protein
MEAIGKLTGGIAHDFNNLLSVISSGLDVLAMHPQYHDEKALLESMQRAVSRGSTMTRQLLSFARQQTLHTNQYNINKLIENFEPLLKQAGNARMTFDIRLEPDLKAVQIDAAGFENALLNLIINAADAMPDGGKICITTSNVQFGENDVPHLQAGNFIHVSVEDTGTGMLPEVAERAFEPFFTTKDMGKGTGLGLSQVYGFIKQSGGDVSLVSKQGEGAIFNIYLPAICDNDIKSESESEKYKGLGMSKSNDTVLIVEDEADVMMVATELFKSLGYEVLTASNGMEAINILESNASIDVLFSDVVMPNGVSGIVLGRSAAKVRPDLKIVLVSGYPLPALKEEHGSLDEFVFLNKPYRLADLARSLRASNVKRLKTSH